MRVSSHRRRNQVLGRGLIRTDLGDEVKAGGREVNTRTLVIVSLNGSFFLTTKTGLFNAKNAVITGRYKRP